MKELRYLVRVTRPDVRDHELEGRIRQTVEEHKHELDNIAGVIAGLTDPASGARQQIKKSKAMFETLQDECHKDLHGRVMALRASLAKSNYEEQVIVFEKDLQKVEDRMKVVDADLKRMAKVKPNSAWFYAQWFGILPASLIDGYMLAKALRFSGEVLLFEILITAVTTGTLFWLHKTMALKIKAAQGSAKKRLKMQFYGGLAVFFLATLVLRALLPEEGQSPFLLALGLTVINYGINIAASLVAEHFCPGPEEVKKKEARVAVEAELKELQQQKNHINTQWSNAKKEYQELVALEAEQLDYSVGIVSWIQSLRDECIEHFLTELSIKADKDFSGLYEAKVIDTKHTEL